MWPESSDGGRSKSWLSGNDMSPSTCFNLAPTLETKTIQGGTGEAKVDNLEMELRYSRMNQILTGAIVCAFFCCFFVFHVTKFHNTFPKFWGTLKRVPRHSVWESLVYSYISLLLCLWNVSKFEMTSSVAPFAQYSFVTRRTGASYFRCILIVLKVNSVFKKQTNPAGVKILVLEVIKTLLNLSPGAANKWSPHVNVVFWEA